MIAILRPLPAALSLCLTLALAVPPAQADGFRVRPYLQNPAPDAMTVVWFSDEDLPGSVEVFAGADATPLHRLTSSPERADGLAYPQWESSSFFAGQAPLPPFAHRVRVTGLEPGTAYRYAVTQGAERAESRLRTAPAPDQDAIRLVFFADSETEPESTDDRVNWPASDGGAAERRYLLDQTDGFARNLSVILEREPDLLAVAGDLVESGGEQRDWDEFWKHLTDVDGINLAGRIPVLAAPGNHEYYEGPRMGRYNQPGSERAVEKFRSYFANPDNGDPDPRARGRYYRVDYGPVTVIALDVTNGAPHQSEHDTNFFLLGSGETGGGHSPGFGPGTRQYEWLETQLADARQRSAFTFIFFHHVPYSVGPHGWPAGTGDGQDQQSGVPVRQLTPLFHHYGVDAVIAGHDEMWERSEIVGEEVADDGTRRPHVLQVYDVGIAGDGLRGPQEGLENPHQKFLAHTDAPEVWEDGVLVSGGKHYGHLEVDVLRAGESGWEAVLKPVHIFPRFAADGSDLGPERRLYDDVVTLVSGPPATAVTGTSGTVPADWGFEHPYPNPFNATVLLRFRLATAGDVRIDVYDSLGQRVRRLLAGPMEAGTHAVEWDATDADGNPAATGVYLFGLTAGSLRDSVEAALVR